jgi:hypothetical protein
VRRETRARGERKGCQEIGENKVSKESRDIWVFQEMPVKKVSLGSKEGLENPVSQDSLAKQGDPVILVCRVK